MSNPIGDALGEAEKKLDKLLISTFTASHAVASAENREQLTEETEKEKIKTFKDKNKKQMKSLNRAIKGKWFDSAEKALKEARNKFEDI